MAQKEEPQLHKKHHHQGNNRLLHSTAYTCIQNPNIVPVYCKTVTHLQNVDNNNALLSCKKILAMHIMCNDK